jgi:hypothetical protein
MGGGESAREWPVGKKESERDRKKEREGGVKRVCVGVCGGRERETERGEGAGEGDRERERGRGRATLE